MDIAKSVFNCWLFISTSYVVIFIVALAYDRIRNPERWKDEVPNE